MTNRAQQGALVCVIFVLFAALLVGVASIVGGGYVFVQSWQWTRSSTPTSAVVEEQHLHQVDDYQDPYEATVFFKTLDGEPVSAMVVGYWFEPGSTVGIRYDPADPTSAGMSANQRSDHAASAIAVVVGVIFLAISIPLVLLVMSCVKALRARPGGSGGVRMDSQRISVSNRRGRS